MRVFSILLISWITVLGLFMTWYLRVPDKIDYKTLAPSQFIEIDGLKVHFVEAGTGPNLLLVHGYASSTYTWHKVWPEFIKHYRVHAIDLPGFGLSDKSRSRTYTLDEQMERLRQFIEKRKLAPVDIIAWSMGGQISMWLAKNHPELIRKIVFVTPAFHRDIVFVPVQFARWTAPLLADWVITPQSVKLSFWRVFENPVEDRDNFALQAYYPFHRSPDAYYSLVSAMALMADRRNPDAFTDVETPFRVLLSRKDHVIPFRLYTRFKEMYPDAEIFVHETAGHGLMVDEPEWVIQKSLEFIQQ